MNIFNKLTLQNMMKHRSRTLATIIGVILSAMLITSISTFGVSLLNYLINGSIYKYGSWHIALFNVSASFVDEQRKNPDVADVVTFTEVPEVIAHYDSSKPDYHIDNRLYGMLITLNNPRNLPTYIANIVPGYEYLLNDRVLRFMGLSEDTIFHTLLTIIGGIIIFIVMAGSVTMLKNTFQISINERTKQFGLLASIGATPKQLLHSILFEGLCYAVIGLPLGILLGIVSLSILFPTISSSMEHILYSGISFSLILSPSAIMITIIISILTISLSVYLPAKKAVNIPIMDSILQNFDSDLTIKKDHLEDFTNPFRQSQFLSLETILALRSYKRNKKRYHSVVLSLSISIILFFCSNSIISYLRQLSDYILKYNLNNKLDKLAKNQDTVFLFNIFSYLFIIMITLIAITNVFNTISTNILHRKRELAMLRSIGISDHSFQKMQNIEYALYGLRALLFGLPIAIFLTWIIYRELIYIDISSMVYEFPWVSILISILVVFLVVFMTMLYATHKIKSENIMDSLRDDIT